MRRVERLPRLWQRFLRDLALRQRHAQLVTLPDVAKVARAGEGCLGKGNVIRLERRHEAGLHFCEASVELPEVDRPADLKLRLDGVVFEVGRAKPHGRGDSRIGRRDHFRNGENGGDLRGLQRAGPAEGDERKAARVDALLDRTGADRVRHIGVDDGEDALRRLAEAEAELDCKPADGAVRRFRVELHATAEEVIRVEPAENQIGVCHRRLFAAHPISRGSRRGARAARPHPKRSAVVDVSDGAAARADSVDVNHGGQQRKAGDGRRTRVRFRQLSIDDDSDFRAHAADVERDQLASLRQLPDPRPRQHASRQPRKQRQRRLLRHHARRRHAPVRRHDPKIGRKARAFERSVEVGDIRPDFRPDEGRQRSRGESLELAKLRGYEGGCGDERLRKNFRHDRLDAVLMRWIEVGEEKAGVTYQLPAVAAAFLGSTCVAPGRFNPWGATVAVYFLVTGITGLVFLGFSSFIQEMFYGGALVIAVTLSQLVRGCQEQQF